jgi:hypothetical protein
VRPTLKVFRAPRSRVSCSLESLSRALPPQWWAAAIPAAAAVRTLCIMLFIAELMGYQPHGRLCMGPHRLVLAHAHHLGHCVACTGRAHISSLSSRFRAVEWGTSGASSACQRHMSKAPSHIFLSNFFCWSFCARLIQAQLVMLVGNESRVHQPNSNYGLFYKKTSAVQPHCLCLEEGCVALFCCYFFFADAEDLDAPEAAEEYQTVIKRQ